MGKVVGKDFAPGREIFLRRRVSSKGPLPHRISRGGTHPKVNFRRVVFLARKVKISFRRSVSI